ncbi:RANBP2-like and GRIP domain-containing protein 8 isoform X3 [Haliotis rubra]|uniref:RANBP2-like and GRIP domain-containing protein 8 isoform X3 n=1 Tax=Haliotis rubra TaxID=36100 RepID=UPI001EE56B0B|nr:RANBP2-like and GRIP domain-containing protein 8 isoform X3 [Haliotis rubra]
MFRTKQDVDGHAANVLGRIKNEKEKNSRGYQIARLYFSVSEYEVAKRYLSSFLSVRETVPQAHKLMGHIFLKTNEKEKALECYKRALELDGTQKDLIIKICELCTQVAMDPERTRFWLEKAEQTCPGNDVIFRLREMIAQNSGDENFKELEKLIITELTQRPDDVSLRVKLLHLYLKSGRLDHAYNVAVQTDRTMAFTDSPEWYETLLDVYYAYKGKNGCRGDLGFYTQFLHTLRNVVYLRLCYRELIACAEILHQFDQVLQEAVQIPKQQDDWMSFLTEMTGQFFFSCGTLLLKRAQKGVLSWKDVIPQASVCYLLNNSILTIDSRSEWFVSASMDKKSMYDHLHMISNFRRSQGGTGTPPVPKHRLFKDDTDQDLDEAITKVLMSEVQYAVGCSAMKKHKHEEAINIFDKLHTPYASLNSAKIYKVLAEQERSRDAPEGREHHQILLTKARDAIFRTFDLLQGDKKHELNKSVQQLLDDVESQLQCVSEWDEDEEPSQYHTPTAIQLDGDVSSPDHSTPREKSRTKSPAAQVSFNTSDIRSLAYSQESLVKMVLARAMRSWSRSTASLWRP